MRGTRPSRQPVGVREQTRKASWRGLAAALVLVVLAGAGCAGSDSSGEAPQSQDAGVAVTAIAEPSRVQEAVAGGAELIDVRTPEEFAAGHLRGAVNIDLSAPDFDERIGALDKTGSYVVYCASGNRAGTAIDMMSRQGFDDLVNGGGFEDLAASGLPAE
ncbi:rhodanese-like domain-containing protein [Nocardioides sp.]|uniref:rhodanese-like domain-containing protein n=1 Tax=Nocardioides sp. TaxID=35761 RepID=UPI002EDAE2AE